MRELFAGAGLQRIELASDLDDAVGRADRIARELMPPRRAGDGPAEPGRHQLRHVHRLRPPRRGVQGRGPPAGGREGQHMTAARKPASAAVKQFRGPQRRAPRARLPAARQRRRARRDRAADGLFELGRGRAAVRRRPVRRRRAAGVLGRAGRSGDGRLHAPRLPLPALRLGRRLPDARSCCWWWCCCRRSDPSSPIEEGGSVRWLRDRPAAAHAPGRVRQAGAAHLPRPLAGAQGHDRRIADATASCRSC